MSESKPRIKQYILFDQESTCKEQKLKNTRGIDMSSGIGKALSLWQSTYLSGLGYDEDCLPDCLIVQDADFFGIYFHADMSRIPDDWIPDHIWVWKRLPSHCRLEEYESLKSRRSRAGDLAPVQRSAEPGLFLLESKVRHFSLVSVFTVGVR